MPILQSILNTNGNVVQMILVLGQVDSKLGSGKYQNKIFRCFTGLWYMNE